MSKFSPALRLPLAAGPGARDEPGGSRERRIVFIMAEWWSIEVLHGEFSAFRWQEQHDSALIEAALTNGAGDGSWHADSWGVVFEVLFETGEHWQAFRNLPACARPWTPCPTPLTACSSIVAGAGGQAPGNRAGQSPRQPPVLSRCLSPRPSHSWT